MSVRNAVLILFTQLLTIKANFETTSLSPTRTPMTPPFIQRSSTSRMLAYGENYFPWETGGDPLTYYKNYCAWSCYGSSKPVVWEPNCYPCSCSTFCQEYGTCCPEKEPDWAREILTNGGGSNKDSYELPPVTVKTRRSQFICEDKVLSKSSLLVGRCPSTEVNSSLVGLCEADLTATVDQFVPVSNQETGLTYRNKFCLECSHKENMNVQIVDHNTQSLNAMSVTDTTIVTFIKWSLKISCIHYQNLYSVTSQDAFLKEASTESVCKVNLLAPDDVPEPERCDTEFFWSKKERQSASCKHPDERLANLCAQVDLLLFSTSYYGQTLFCMLCDGEIPLIRNNPPTGFTFPPTVRTSIGVRSTTNPVTLGPVFIPPLSLLLGISRRRQPQLPKCSNITWWDESGECQPALCPPGKVIDEGGKCLSAIDQIRGLGYKLFLVLRPRIPQMVTGADIQSLSNHISAVIEDISLESITDVSIAVWHNGIDAGYGNLHQITVSAYLVGNDTIGRDEYEEQLLSLVSGAWVVAGANESKKDIDLKPVLIGEELKEFEETDNEDVEGTITLPIPRPPPRLSGLSAPIFTTPPAATTTTPSKPTKIMYTERHTTSILRANLWRLRRIFIDVTQSLACPAVPVNITNSTTSEENLPIMTFLFLGETVTIKSTQNIAMVKGQVQLCTSYYKKLTTPVLTRTRQTVLEQVQYYMEVICVSLSVTCLLLSSLTYCLFPSLRTLPGMNNLSLCLSLVVAQVCLLITARYGVNQAMPSGYCLVHAVVLHFSWLASFAWMSVCCIHMFRVFTARSNKFTDNRSDKRRYLQYCFYGFGVPVLVLIATFIVNAVMTSGESIGYNEDICFLDTRRSIWTLALALLTPLCLVILTNGVMFVLTVKEIVQVTNLQENQRSRERQGVLTYVKLSTLTGLLGAVVVIAVQLNNSVVSLLTSPLMALQGVFIFVSFTCNQRVRLLYLDLSRRLGLPCVSETETTTSTGSTAVRTSSNGPSKAKTASTITS